MALKNVKPEYIGNETSARSYMLGECNYFHQVGAPFWTFCFEMYTQNFNAFWNDLRVKEEPIQVCKALVFVLFGLIGVAIALHGTGAYGNNAGGYGNGGYGNGGGGHKHHKSSESSSSESEEAIPPRPKTCKYSCTTDPTITIRSSPDATYACRNNANNLANCQNCCEHFALEKGVDRNNVIANDIGTGGTKSCNCCMRKCT
uniref:Uncharacterized protein n=1 Tax=Panagrolaimus davidi TaxID=227884 RepID=A0A914QWQ5_9BILA